MKKIRNISINLDTSITSKEIVNEFPKRYLPMITKNNIYINQLNAIRNSLLKNANLQANGGNRNYTHEKVMKKVVDDNV